MPFAFACFVMRNAYWRAGLALFLLLLFYPITLTKLSLFAPLWLVATERVQAVAGAAAAVSS